MRDRSGCRLLLVPTAAVLLMLAFVVPAQADSASGFLSLARGCEDVGCFAETFSLDDTSAVSGTLTLDEGAGTIQFDLALGSPANLSATNGDDNGVADIVFSAVSYASDGTLSITELIPGTWEIDFGQTADVAGTQEQLDGGGATVVGPVGFAVAAEVSGLCTVVAGNATCGLSFGTSGFELGVGDPAEARLFEQTLNVVTPEPTTAALWMGGMLVVALTGRRRA